MPNGLWYAGGPYRTRDAKAASAFSTGDVLMLDSSSSLSRINPLIAAATAEVAGIAVGDSTQSTRDGLISYLAPEPNTEFWASAQSNLASHLTVGEERDLLFDTANNRYYVADSTATARVVIVAGTDTISQSVQSKVRVRFIGNAGALKFS